MSLKKILNDGFTNEKDESEFILYGIALSLVVGLVLTCVDVVAHSAHFDFTSFGVGVGSILSLGGGGYLLKRVGDKNGQPDVGTTTSETSSVRTSSTLP